MYGYRAFRATGLLTAFSFFGFFGCNDNSLDNSFNNSCLPELTTVMITSTGSVGTAQVFNPDPLVISQNPFLNPSSDLDQYRQAVTLDHLGGHGVLEGNYVDVRTNKNCNQGFGAVSLKNEFSFSHSQPQFQEAMSYYFGDRFRAKQSEAKTLANATPLRIIAHCQSMDNAFYTKGRANGVVIEEVCLGDSVATPGSSYADDATVVVHEAQHETTTDTYSVTQDFNQLIYDEAGALNEAISDFVALVFLEPTVPTNLITSVGFDPRLFGRWSLGHFLNGFKATRGVNRCPSYSSDYPNCGQFPTFNADQNIVSYVYPDGMGWPYANNFSGPNYVRNAFNFYSGQEEIHNAGVLISGALWDIYQVLKDSRGGDQDAAFMAAHQLAMEAVRHLPRPTSTETSPVTLVGYASALVDATKALKFSATDASEVTRVLTERGLYGFPTLSDSWAEVGPGLADTPGLRIVDDPTTLKKWLTALRDSTSAIKQTSGNGKLNPGDVAAVFFDIKNVSSNGLTAGSLKLSVNPEDSDIQLLNDHYNFGLIDTSTTQIRYGKVNGTNIVGALSSTNDSNHLSTGTTYFTTNPYHSNSSATAVWVKVNSNAESGKTVNFRVEITPANGQVVTLRFPAIIQ